MPKIKIIIAPAGFWPRRPKPEEAPRKSPRIERKISLYQKKPRFLRNGSQRIAQKYAKDCPKVHKGLPKVCWGSNKHAKDSGSRVSPTRLFRSYGHFVMAYAYGYSEPYSTADKERSESQKGPRDFFLVFSVSVVETHENEIRFDINFTCKGRSRDRFISFYTINSIHICKR